MPEGPSIVILKEQAMPFKGKKVIGVSGNAKINKEQALHQEVTDFKSWGKHFLICFHDFTIRIHLMLFGSYRINEEKDAEPRLSLEFKEGSLHFYACSVKMLGADLDAVYDWSADIMSDEWNAQAALEKLKQHPDQLVCDALLDQNIFSGSGNIIKNEVLFRLRLHPLSRTGQLPSRLPARLVQETRDYAFDFLKWKKEYTLRQHWQVHTRKMCPRCHIPLIKEYLGKTARRTFYCSNCQLLYE